MKDVQERSPAAYCRLCGCEIYEYEGHYLIMGETICAECVDASFQS